MSNILAQLAQRRLEEAKKKKFAEDKKKSAHQQANKAATALLDFIPKINPRFMPPRHLAELLALFERAEREPIRAVVSVPPRHGKTISLLSSIAWTMLRRPEMTCAYASYALQFSYSKARLARDYAIEAGVTFRDDTQSVAECRTPAGGGLLTTSVGGSITGHGVNLFVIDDPHKDRAHAESSVDRAFIQEWMAGTAMSRVEPGGSVIVNAVRWHDDDLIGHLLRDKNVHWEEINLPALDAQERPLWPEGGWTRETLLSRRAEVGEYDWASQYMGRPQPRGGQLFGDVTFYDELPTDGYRVGVGVDMAYTTRALSDYSVAIVMHRRGGVTYIVDLIRMQVLQPVFLARLKAEAENKLKGARWRSYVSTTEKGITDLAMADGLPIHGMIATGDKFVRAQPVAAAWNAGNVRVPRDAPWLDEFIRELQAFPKGRHDDQVDALAAAFDVLNLSNVKAPPVATVDLDAAGIYAE